MNRQREMNLIDTRCSPSFIGFYVCMCALILQVCSNTHIRKCKCVYVCSVELNNQRICRRCRFSLSLLFLSLSLLYLSLLFLSLFSFQVAFTTILKRTNRRENYYHDELFIEVVQSLSSHATKR